MTTWHRLLADAHALPFPDGFFDVVVADPPYELRGHSPGGRNGSGNTADRTGYRPFTDRAWWQEAMRVVNGHLYIVAIQRDMYCWLREFPEPHTVLVWLRGRNTSGLRLPNRLRSPAWQPVMHYVSGPEYLPDRPTVLGDYVEALKIRKHPGEDMPYPNQLPLVLCRWLLAPHVATSMAERLPRVLDLFSGTGAVGQAAVELGMDAWSVDANPKALALSRRRVPNLPLSAM